MELRNRGILEVIIMSIRRLSLAVFILLIGCQQAVVNGDKQVSIGNEVSSGTELDRQLQINKSALLDGTSEQIRLDAAMIMLHSESVEARKVLISVLRQGQNAEARTSVCRALSQSRSTGEPIKNKADFIEPLFDMLREDDSGQGKLAAESMLIFDYERISKQLQDAATNRTEPVKARLNAMYALRMQPDMRAIITLTGLLDDPDKQISAEAEKAVRFLGIPVGKDIEVRQQIINELKRKGRDVFLRDWLLRQEEQIRRLEKEAEVWQKLYLSSLDRIYEGLGTDAAKGKFLAEQLNDPKFAVKLWALEKVSQWRVGTKGRLPADTIGVILTGFISNENREIRLKTAKLLSLMVEVDSAAKLLEQVKVEQDEEVKAEFFVALGGACYYAFLPNSGIKIAPEIKKQTLGIATKYLASEDSKMAQKGAEVIKKLLEQDGLTPIEVEGYLGLLAQKYEYQKGNNDSVLRGELLNGMAGLCAQSAYKAEAAKRFGPLFEQALNDEAKLVREAAMDGLIYIDKTKALQLLRKNFVNDESGGVQKRLTDLGGEVGGTEDLSWLAERIGAKAEGEQAWQAMLKIFKRSDYTVVSEWVAKFGSSEARYPLTDEQKLSFLELAERKAAGENRPEMLKDVKGYLATVYVKMGEFKRAAESLGFLVQQAQSPDAKSAAVGRLLEVYLRWPNMKAAVDLVSNSLLEKDLEPNSVIILTIDGFLSSPNVGSDPNMALSELSKIQLSSPRPVWFGCIKGWQAKLGSIQKADEPKPTGVK